MIANLQHQMRPHFIVNTLNLIYNNTYTGNDELIRKVIEHLTSYLRYTLHSDRAIVPLHREISYIRDYLEIQRCYYQDMLFYSLDVDPACEEIPTPCLLLTPLVETASSTDFTAKGRHKSTYRAHCRPAETGCGFPCGITAKGFRRRR